MSYRRVSLLLLTIISLIAILAACGGGEATPSSMFPDDGPTSIATSGPDQTAGRTKVMVSRVIDGDTIEIEGGKIVRYLGIDAPEFTPYKEDTFGREAYEHNKNLVEGKEVELEKDVSDTDDYGRLLRYVFVDGMFVNADMVSQGFARAQESSTDLKYQEMFKTLQADAKQSQLGLWADEQVAEATPNGENTPEATETPDEEATQEPSETPEATETTEPEETPTATPTPTPAATPTPTATPTPAETETPKPLGTDVRIGSFSPASEMVSLVNIGSQPADLQGWSILSVTTGQTFTFSFSLVLAPGQSVNVWTHGSGISGSDVYMGFSSDLWADPGARCELYSPAGNLVDAAQ